MLEVGALPSALLALAGIAKLRARAGQAAQALRLRADSDPPGV